MQSLWPARCPGCDEALLPEERRRGWCGECASQRLFAAEPYCMHCGRPLVSAADRFCVSCAHRAEGIAAENIAPIRRADALGLTQPSPALIQNRAVYLYDGVVKDAIHRLKYANRRSYARVLATDAAVSVSAWIRDIGAEVIVPAPMHPKRLAQRGYNQAQLLAQALGKRCGLPCESLLERTRNVRPQQQLGRAERMHNLKGVMTVPGPLRARAAALGCVLLVDDVYTTGASMEEAARALSAAGVQRVYGLVIAISGRSDPL